MADFLFRIDAGIFYFLNNGLANPLFDVVMPVLTDLNKTAYGRGTAALLVILLVWKGGRKGRIAALFLIPLIFLSDQLSSSVLKKIVERPRPCHLIDGTTVLQHIRLLVDCGSGYSFPSSHATNNFAAAMYFSFFYRRLWGAFFIFASIVGFSRVYVGVHFPFDIVGGAVAGILCAGVIIGILVLLQKRFPILRYGTPIQSESDERSHRV